MLDPSGDQPGSVFMSGQIVSCLVIAPGQVGHVGPSAFIT